MSESRRVHYCLCVVLPLRREVGCNNPAGVIGLGLFVPFLCLWRRAGGSAGRKSRVAAADWPPRRRFRLDGGCATRELSSVLLAKLWPGARRKKKAPTRRPRGRQLLLLLRLIVPADACSPDTATSCCCQGGAKEPPSGPRPWSKFCTVFLGVVFAMGAVQSWGWACWYLRTRFNCTRVWS
ncbi:hypothetical protein VTN96DRAFT_1947 [Rasamsonia emersonii]